MDDSIRLRKQENSQNSLFSLPSGLDKHLHAPGTVSEKEQSGFLLGKGGIPLWFKNMVISCLWVMKF